MCTKNLESTLSCADEPLQTNYWASSVKRAWGVLRSRLRLCLHGTGPEPFPNRTGPDRLLFTWNCLEPVQVFTRDLSGTGLDQIRYWICKTAGPVLDPFRTGSRTAYPVRKSDRIRSGPVPCKHSLRVHGSATPVPLHVAAERTNETKRRFTLPPKQLSYPESMATSCTSVTSKPETNKFKSPLDVFLEEKRKAVDFKKTRVSQLQAAVIESSLSSTGSTPYTRRTRKPVYTNCHTEGHNKLHCEFGQCLSAQYCNLLEKHPDEKKELGEHEKATESRGRQTGTTRRRTAGESGSSCISPKLLLLQSPRYVNPIQTGGEGWLCLHWLRTFITFFISKLNPPNLVTFLKIYQATIWHSKWLSIKFDVTMATTFWQAVFSEF